MEMNEQTPSNGAYLQPAGSTVSCERGTWNRKMSIKYQVMRANLGTYDWTSAWNACKAYSGEGGAAGTWRLPTQRELMMILIYHPQLIEKGGFTAFNTQQYWSATEYTTSGNAWNVYFGNTGYIGKNNKFRVRCVRDR